MNTITGAFGRFTGMDANCWAILNENLYFGGADAVYQAWNGTIDVSSDIPFDLKQAFSYFGSKRLKQFKSMRSNLLSDGVPSVLIGVNTDFSDSAITGEATFTPPSAGVWDTATWDNDEWGTDDLQAYNDWQTVNGVGTSAAPRMKGQISNLNLHMAATDFVFEHGGVIA